MEIGANIRDAAFDCDAVVDYCVDFLRESIDFYTPGYDVYRLRGLHEIALEDVLLCEVSGYAFGCALAAERFLYGFAEPRVYFRAVFGSTLESGEVSLLISFG